MHIHIHILPLSLSVCVSIWPVSSHEIDETGQMETDGGSTYTVCTVPCCFLHSFKKGKMWAAPWTGGGPAAGAEALAAASRDFLISRTLPRRIFGVGPWIPCFFKMFRILLGFITKEK